MVEPVTAVTRVVTLKVTSKYMKINYLSKGYCSYRKK